MWYHDSWGKILSKEVQFRCKISPDAVGSAANILCADAWYGDEKGYPSFAEQAGRSLVMSQTARGDAFLRDAIAVVVSLILLPKMIIHLGIQSTLGQRLLQIVEQTSLIKGCARRTAGKQLVQKLIGYRWGFAS